ncbi:MAG TPA: hypothetical protein DHW82_05450 [Spirochaetia bacterium]|nr:MAG: hypothetical protein A2Y41_09050 [Spirochaetes bacterium GWB1_36_13]HCL56438.1 hypothetical protein [Spirochaetia bacterium]
MSVIKDILRYKKEEVQFLKKSEKEFLEKAEKKSPIPLFSHLFQDKITLAAGMKKASQSLGVMRKEIDLTQTAKNFEKLGIQVFSVATDSKYYQGSLSLLENIKQAVHVPVIQEDFVIHPIQLLWAKSAGADGSVIIASLLSSSDIKKLLKESETLGLQCLVEIASEEDLKKALKADASYFRINNRNIETGQVNISNALKIFHKIPSEKKTALQGGITSIRDIQLFLEVGLKAFFLGKYLLEQNDPTATVQTIQNLI